MISSPPPLTCYSCKMDGYQPMAPHPRQTSKQPIVLTALVTLATAFVVWAAFLRPTSVPVPTKVCNPPFCDGRACNHHLDACSCSPLRFPGCGGAEGRLRRQRHRDLHPGLCRRARVHHRPAQRPRRLRSPRLPRPVRQHFLTIYSSSALTSRFAAPRVTSAAAASPPARTSTRRA